MKIIELLRTARWIMSRQKPDRVIMSVPKELAPRVASAVWEYDVSHAAERWGTDDSDIPLADWQAAMRRMVDERIERGRDGKNDRM